MISSRAILLLVAHLSTGLESGLRSQVIVKSELGKDEAKKRDQIFSNTRRLKVTIQMDRKEYFPGEDAEITLFILNQGATPLEVFEPFHVRTGGLDLFIRDSSKPKTDPRSQWLPVSPDYPGGVGTHDSQVPTTWIQPMEKLRRTFELSDPDTHSVIDKEGKRRLSTICSACMIPETEGEYEFRYSYHSDARVSFRVVAPILERWAEVVLQSPRLYRHIDINQKATGKVQNIPRRVRIGVLGYAGSHYVIASVAAIAVTDQSPIEPTSRFSEYITRQFGIYRRVAVSQKAIVSLQAKADREENITVLYTDQDARQVTVRLDPKRRVIP